MKKLTLICEAARTMSRSVMATRRQEATGGLNAGTPTGDRRRCGLNKFRDKSRPEPLRTQNAAPGYAIAHARAVANTCAVAIAGAALAALLLTVIAPPPAQAKQVVADGTHETASGAFDTGTYSTSAGYALWAKNKGSITSTAALTLITAGIEAHGVSADSGGQIIIDSASSSIKTTGPAAYGINARGEGSTVSVVDTVIQATGLNNVGVYAHGGSHIFLTRGSLTVPKISGSYAALYAFNDGSGTAKISAVDVMIEAGGHGVEANLGGSIDLTGGAVTTTGNLGHGLYTIGDGAALTAKGTSVSTGGADAIGAYALSGHMELSNTVIKTTGKSADGAVVDNANTLTVAGGSVSTAGVLSDGLISYLGSTLTAVNTDVETTGDSSAGARAYKGGHLLLTGSTLATSGASSFGLSSRALSEITTGTGASLTADSTVVTTAGENSHGAMVYGGSSLTLQNGSSVSTAGKGAAALFSTVSKDSNTGTIESNPSTVTVTGSALASAQSVGVYVTGTTLNINLTGSSVTGAQAWVAVSDADAVPSTLNLSADASTLTGAGLKDAASAANISLKNGSAWEMTGNSSVGNLDNGASSITFTAPADSAASYKILTTVGYTSSSGTIIMNASLGNDSAPADRLEVSGQPVGTTTLQVRNTDGAGAPTTDGILLVKTGKPASADAFVLAASPIRVGGYDYTLVQGDAGGGQKENWYLRSEKADPLADATPVPALTAPALMLLALALVVAARIAPANLAAGYLARRGRKERQ